jgi:hypothetical protein
MYITVKIHSLKKYNLFFWYRRPNYISLTNVKGENH